MDDQTTPGSDGANRRADLVRWAGAIFFAVVAVTQFLPVVFDVGFQGLTLWRLTEGHFSARILLVVPIVLPAAATVCLAARRSPVVPIAAMVALSPWLLWKTVDLPRARGVSLLLTLRSLDDPGFGYTVVYQLMVVAQLALFVVGVVGLGWPLARAAVRLVGRWFGSDDSLIGGSISSFVVGPDLIPAIIGFVLAVLTSVTHLVTIDVPNGPNVGFFRAIDLGLLPGARLPDRLMHVVAEVVMVAAFVGVLRRAATFRRSVWLGCSVAGAVLLLITATYRVDDTQGIYGTVTYRPTVAGLALSLLTTTAFVLAAWATTLGGTPAEADAVEAEPVLGPEPSPVLG